MHAVVHSTEVSRYPCPTFYFTHPLFIVKVFTIPIKSFIHRKTFFFILSLFTSESSFMHSAGQLSSASHGMLMYRVGQLVSASYGMLIYRVGQLSSASHDVSMHRMGQLSSASYGMLIYRVGQLASASHASQEK